MLVVWILGRVGKKLCSLVGMWVGAACCYCGMLVRMVCCWEATLGRYVMAMLVGWDAGRNGM